MIQKKFYETLEMEIILYSIEDIVRTSLVDNINSEVGGAWDDAWGE